MSNNKNFPKHLVRYGTIAEQKHIADFQDLFDAVVINANMLAHASKAISTFLYRDVQKPYIIDPMTHAFQHDLNWIYNDSGKLKSSIKKLIEEYGSIIDKAILQEKRPLRSEDLTDININSLVNNVLDFQKNYAKDKVDEEYKDYIKYLNISREPEILIAPYFYLSSTNKDKWLDINEKCINESIKKKQDFDLPVFSQLVISKDLLKNNSFIEKALDIYGQADGVMYWIDGLDEATASEEELKSIVSVVNYLKINFPTKIIISLYGGYYSQLLMKNGLDGVVHGMQYGEKREVVPVGGGIPRAKFYIPALKQRFDATAVIPIFYKFNVDSKKKFKSNICICSNCDNNISDDSKGIEKVIEDFSVYLQTKPIQINYKSGVTREVEFPISESKEQCLFHYLHVKHMEHQEVDNKSLEKLLELLLDEYNKYEPFFAESELDYILRWTKVLSV